MTNNFKRHRRRLCIFYHVQNSHRRNNKNNKQKSRNNRSNSFNQPSLRKKLVKLRGEQGINNNIRNNNNYTKHNSHGVVMKIRQLPHRKGTPILKPQG